MRKTQKNVMVALHVLDLERECMGVSWLVFFFALLNSHIIIVRTAQNIRPCKLHCHPRG